MAGVARQRIRVARAAHQDRRNERYAPPPPTASPLLVRAHPLLFPIAAGRGLVADGDVPPNTRLINIPSRALLNTVTLCPLYPLHFTRTFTATQWVSLHLALQTSRHASGPPPSPSPRDHFQPFLRSLPESFPTVPLEWSIKSRSLDELRKEFGVPVDDHSLDEEMATPAGRRRFGKLLELMPPSVRVRAEDVEKRFKSDWLRVREVWVSSCSCFSLIPMMSKLLYYRPPIVRRMRKSRTGCFSRTICLHG